VRERTLLGIDLGLKALLVGLLAFGAFSGLEQFEGKAFGWRLLTYPLAAAVLPVGWWLAGRPRPNPYLIDMLFVRRSSRTCWATRSTSTTASTRGTT
jgi:hypothetical protein